MVTLRNREVEDAKEGTSDGHENVENDEPSNERHAGKDVKAVKSGDKAKKGKIDSKLLARAEFLQSMLLLDTFCSLLDLYFTPWLIFFPPPSLCMPIQPIEDGSLSTKSFAESNMSSSCFFGSEYQKLYFDHLTHGH